MRVLVRLLLVVAALACWVLPGMGVIDLSVTWDESWPVVLEAGWGLLFTIGLGVPLASSAVAPRLSVAALVQVYVVAAALLVGAVAGQEPETWWIFAMLVVDVALLQVLARDRSLRSAPLQRPLLALAAVPAIPAVAYAWRMAELNRQTRADADVTNGTDHYSVQCALALALVALPAVAAIRPVARRLLGTSTALMAGYLGLVSYSAPDSPAAFDRPWSVAVMAWAAAVLVAAWWPGSVEPDAEDQALSPSARPSATKDATRATTSGSRRTFR